MVTYVLDSSAVLRYLHNQAGSDRVAEIIRGHLAGDCEAVTAAPHWGETAGITRKLYGRQEMERTLTRLSALGLQVVAADGDSAVRAALIKIETGIPYVDAFGVELAGRGSDRVLVTADFDFKAAGRQVKIEFLPVK
ncbi:MAG: PIN domain-containing protein [Candidatus Sulfotelmatobacter sp.]|jgi:predicted nucleic acid-binding protein